MVTTGFLLPRNNKVFSNTHTRSSRSNKTSKTQWRSGYRWKFSGGKCSMSHLTFLKPSLTFTGETVKPHKGQGVWCGRLGLTLFYLERWNNLSNLKKVQDALNHVLKIWTTRILSVKWLDGDCCCKVVQATKLQTVFRGRICVGYLHVDITGEQPGHPQPAGLLPIMEMCSCEPFANI